MISIAHRGWHADYPENSRAALKAAYNASFAGAECDVRRSLDGQLIIHHDPAIKAASGATINIANTPGAQLQNTKLGNSNHTPPLLAEVLADLPPEYQLHLELKVPGLVPDVMRHAALASVSHQVYLLLRHKSDLADALAATAPERIVFTHALLVWALFATRLFNNVCISTKNNWFNRWCIKQGVGKSRTIHLYTINSPIQLSKLPANSIKVVYSNCKLDEI